MARARTKRHHSAAPGRAIELRIEHIDQLFHTLDPFPFPDRDLDPHAEEFIVDWARELPGNGPISIVVHLPISESKKKEAEKIATAIRHFFAYRTGAAKRDLRELFRSGRVALLIGMTALAVSLALSQLAVRQFGDEGFGYFLEQGLIIIGWVANWRPIEIFLYQWWPIRRRRSLYLRLSEADIQLHPD